MHHKCGSITVSCPPSERLPTRARGPWATRTTFSGMRGQSQRPVTTRAHGPNAGSSVDSRWHRIVPRARSHDRDLWEGQRGLGVCGGLIMSLIIAVLLATVVWAKPPTTYICTVCVPANTPPQPPATDGSADAPAGPAQAPGLFANT